MRRTRVPGFVRTPDRLRQDRGSASVFVLGLVVVLLVVAGLVADGGRAINARVGIIDDAEQAARAGANQVDLATLRSSGEVRLDTVAAREAATAFLAARGYDGSRMSVSVDQAQVTVSVSDDVPTVLLQLALINSFTVEGTATARPAIGVDDEITGAP